MHFFPVLKLGLANGWIPLAAFYLLFGLMLLILPRAVVKRLYDRSLWTPTQRRLSVLGKLILMIWYLQAVFAPLQLPGWPFNLGLLLFILGAFGMVVALINYSAAPLSEPARMGLYQISRNPQQMTIFLALLGVSFMIGSLSAVLILVTAIYMGHARVLVEEAACLEQYGDAYEDYMQTVPRYFLFW